MDPVQAEAGKRSVGPMVGIIVIILVLVVGAFYIWGGKLSSGDATPLTATDEVTDIQADLNGGSNLNIDLSDIDKNLK